MTRKHIVRNITAPCCGARSRLEVPKRMLRGRMAVTEGVPYKCGNCGETYRVVFEEDGRGVFHVSDKVVVDDPENYEDA